MTARENHRPVRRRLAFGSSLGLAVVLALSGCGGTGTDGGDANFSRKFEKPTGAIPEVKVTPDRISPRDANELSPRERRVQGKNR